jgi:multiple sugar transport system substrate-binding protein
MFNYYRKLLEKSRTLCVAHVNGRRIDIFLLIIAVVVLIFVVTRQTFRAIDKPQRVSINISSQGEALFGGDTVNALIQEFEEQNPGLDIQLSAPDSADIIFFDEGEAGGLIQASALVSLTPYMYAETEAEQQADQWALPLVSFMDLFYYNIDILKAANRDRPPKTRAEFLAAARAVAENNMPVSAFALGLSPADPLALRRDLYPWIWAEGGEVYTTDPAGPALSRAASDAIAFVGQLHREGLLAPGTFDKTGRMRLEEFAEGKIAMMTASAREIAFLRRSAYGVNFGVTAMPSTAPGKNRLGLSGIYAGISGNCTLPEEAWNFLAFIAEKSPVLAAALGAVPGSFPNAFLDEYIEQDPLYSKAWDIFEAADIVAYDGTQPEEKEISRSIREKLAAVLP